MDEGGNSKNHKLLPEEFLTESDVAELLKAATHSRDKAFVSMLYDSGRRIGEIPSLQRERLHGKNLMLSIIRGILSLNEPICFLHGFPCELLELGASLLPSQRSCHSYALMVAENPELHRVDEGLETSAAFPETSASFEDKVVCYTTHKLRERNTILVCICLQCSERYS